MIDVKRAFLYSMLFFVVLTLWGAWQRDHQPREVAVPVTSSAPSEAFVPKAPGSVDRTVTSAVDNSAKVPPVAASDLVDITTDVLNLKIDAASGNLVEAHLLAYKQTLLQPEPFELLNQNTQQFYQAQSGLIQSGAGFQSLQFRAERNQYQLEKNQEKLEIPLTATIPSGLRVKKIYEIFPGRYDMSLRYEVTNQAQTPWSGHLYTQLIRHYSEPVKNGLFSISSYEGAAISDPNNKRYEKLPFKSMADKPLDRQIEGGWLALQQHYFLTAWIPATSTHRYYSNANNGVYTLGATGPKITIEPGKSAEFGATLYVGPELPSVLEKIAPYLDRTIDYGWLWFFSAAIFAVMRWINVLVGNWGWSIVIVTCLIKLVFFPLSSKSYHSMAAMKKLQPRLEALKERFGDDKQKLTQATWELYQKEKVNPFGGCLPILIQIPVFIALYWVLLESVELRQAPFVLWIQDLSAKDPFYVLPIIMGLSMLVQQRLNPPAPDPMQQKMMMFLPIVFTGLFLYFPSGLVLYWVVNNVLSIAQQWAITRKYEQTEKT